MSVSGAASPRNQIGPLTGPSRPASWRTAAAGSRRRWRPSTGRGSTGSRWRAERRRRRRRGGARGAGHRAAALRRDYLPGRVRAFRLGAGNAREAHEAIRPTEFTRTPEALAGTLGEDEARLYGLIWRRALASRMAAARSGRSPHASSRFIVVETTPGVRLAWQGLSCAVTLSAEMRLPLPSPAVSVAARRRKSPPFRLPSGHTGARDGKI